MTENEKQRRINIMARYEVIRKEFYKMTEEAFVANANYLSPGNRSTVGNELYCEFENGRYRVSVRLILMSMNIYVWIYDRQTGKDRMFSLDNPSDQLKKIEAKRSRMAMENMQKRLLQLQNAGANDDLLNSEPAVDYYFKGGFEENMHTVYEYAREINERIKRDHLLI